MVVTYLHISSSSNTPSVEAVSLLRAIYINCLAIGNTSNEMIIMLLIKISTTSAYEKKRIFI